MELVDIVWTAVGEISGSRPDDTFTNLRELTRHYFDSSLDEHIKKIISQYKYGLHITDYDQLSEPSRVFMSIAWEYGKRYGQLLKGLAEDEGDILEGFSNETVFNEVKPPFDWYQRYEKEIYNMFVRGNIEEYIFEERFGLNGTDLIRAVFPLFTTETLPFRLKIRNYATHIDKIEPDFNKVIALTLKIHLMAGFYLGEMYGKHFKSDVENERIG